MGQALYRKHRPKKLGEVVGQEHITSTLTNALQAGKISHAYLFTGPKGVGKTSIARILAHEINDLPYDEEAHLDIIEIDAASNRRIDEIRDLRERVNTAPARAKYKVYIIDEVHMLTKEAFNALLKTLEEPPAHVVFILATTEAHKLPDTIVSRTQRYSFRPVPAAQVIKHLKSIATAEKIAVDDDALQLIATHGDGSFRDSISLLDQVSSVDQKISLQDVERTLGLAPEELLKQLVRQLYGKDGALIVETLGTLSAQGYEPAVVATQLATLVRNDILAGRAADPAHMLTLLRQLIDVPASRNPKLLLEITLLQAATSPLSSAAKQEQAADRQPEASKATPKKALESAAPADIGATAQNNEESRSASTPPARAVPEGTTELWQATLDEIKQQHNTLYGIARMARPELQGSELRLTFKFAFHQKRLNEAKNRKIFSDVVAKLYGKPLEIICVVGDAAPVPAAAPDVTTISNIFGGAELLES